MRTLKENCDLVVKTKKAFKNVLTFWITDSPPTDVFSTYPNLINDFNYENILLNWAFANSDITTFSMPENFQWSKVVSTYRMLQDCSNLTTIQNINTWDFSNIVTCRGMFRNTSITELDLSTLDFSNTKEVSEIVYGCLKLTTVKLPNNLTPIYANHMFFSCSNLTTIEGLDTMDMSKCKTIRSLLAHTKISDLSQLYNWNISNVTDMSFAFYDLQNISSLDLSNWDASNVTKTQQTFAALSLTSLQLPKNLNKVTNIYAMFYNLLVPTLDVSNMETSNVTEMPLVFYMYGVSSTLPEIIGIENWNTDKVTTMYAMFENQKKLISLNLANWNTSNVTNMANMFSICQELQTIQGLSTWDTSNVTNMQAMFQNCLALSNFNDVENWDVSKVTDFSFMFNISNLKSINLSNWNTSNATTMGAMFQGCANLESINFIKDWDISKVTDISYFGNGLNKIKEPLDLSNWDTRNLKSITYAFNRCYALESIDVSNWDLRSCTSADRFMQLSTSLKKLDLSTWKNTDKITTYENFLYNFSASVIEYLDVSGLDTTSVTGNGLKSFVENCIQLDTMIFGEGFGKCKVAITLDLCTIGARWNIKDGEEGSETKYQINTKTYESMLTMYDRKTAGLPAMTIKFSAKHNIPEGWIDKMTERGYTIMVS